MKKILVPLDPSDYSKAATQYACRIAGMFKATVVGIAIIDIEGIDEELKLPFRMDLMDFPRKRGIEMVKSSREELDHLVMHFRQTCEENSVSCDVINTQGVPAVRIVDESRFHDLVVMGLRSHLRFITETDDDDVLENVIRHSCAPLILVPASDPVPIKKVAIAYDGSPPATRALHNFARLAAPLNPEVKIVTSMSPKKGAPLLSSAQSYLEAHGYQNVQVDLVDQSIIEVFQDNYIDWADLCVLGASSKSVFEKVLVGSFPRKLILDGHIPLFINP
ncbi:MAG: universal stress protein [Verrucomicrobiales bacterium]|nr:universal stress protein [Verrucomicrobiales bacterium]